MRHGGRRRLGWLSWEGAGRGWSDRRPGRWNLVFLACNLRVQGGSTDMRLPLNLETSWQHLSLLSTNICGIDT